MVYIVMPVFNRLHFTAECVKALKAQTCHGFRIIVVDDGSTDGTSEWLRSQHPDIIVVKGDGNLWWTGSMNLGVSKAIELSDSITDHILTINNDLVVGPDYLSTMLAIARKCPRTLLGSVSVDITAPDRVHFAGTSWNSKTASYRPSVRQMSYPALVQYSESIETDLLPGRGVLIPIYAFKEIGLYDQKYFPHYMADEDFALRARREGFRLLIATRAVVYSHVNDSGLRKQPRNLKYYRDVFTSIKSPANALQRWYWAKRHASVPAPVYFVFDVMRIVKSLVFK